MAINTTGIDELGKQIELLGRSAQGIAAASLYEGAAVVGSALNAGLDSIKTSEFKYAKNGNSRLPSPEEVNALRGAVGTAKFSKTGLDVNTSVGFSSGYADVAGNKKAIPLIARSINSGTSFMMKQPFIRKAKNASKAAAEAAIVAKAESMIKNIIEKG